MDKIEKTNAVLKEIEEALVKDVELVESLIGSDPELLMYYIENRKKQTKNHQECLKLTMLKLNDYSKDSKQTNH